MQNVSFFAVDIERVFRERPEQGAALVNRVLERVAEKRYRPLPVTEYPITEATKAFRHMAQSQHAGSLCCAYRRAAARPRSGASARTRRISSREEPGRSVSRQRNPWSTKARAISCSAAAVARTGRARAPSRQCAPQVPTFAKKRSTWPTRPPSRW